MSVDPVPVSPPAAVYALTVAIGVTGMGIAAVGAWVGRRSPKLAGGLGIAACGLGSVAAGVGVLGWYFASTAMGAKGDARLLDFLLHYAYAEPRRALWAGLVMACASGVSGLVVLRRSKTIRAG